MEITSTDGPSFESDSKFFGKVFPDGFDLFRNLNSDPPFREGPLKQSNSFAPYYEGDVELVGDHSVILIRTRLDHTVFAFGLLWYLALLVGAIASFFAGIQGRLAVEPYVPALAISAMFVVGIAQFNIPFHRERRKGLALLKEKLEATEVDDNVAEAARNFEVGK